jgi:hypothetical protein
MTVITPPRLGIISVQIENVTLTSPDFGDCSVGHSGKGKVVYYAARAPGTDTFEYRMSSPGLPTTDWNVRVEVR